MYNTYISSTLALRTKTSLCYSVNDYYLVNQTRFQNNSFSSSPCSSCCSCCAFPMYGGVPPINPRFLYGLKQSTLIQCSASKKLILGRGESGYCHRLPVCNSDSICYGDSYSVKESSRNKEKDFGKRGRKFSCMVWEEECENFDSGIDENTEAMLSLLTEDIGEKLVDVGRRINRSRNSEIRVERRSRGVSEGIKEEKKYVDSGSSRKNSSCKCQSVTIKSREEGNRQSKGTLDSSRGENRRARKGEFSRSSYYSGGIVVGRRGRDGNECIKEEEKRVESCSLGRNSSWEIESTKNKSREEGSRWSCETEVPSRGESVGFRKEGSSCSSYYSNLSSDTIDESNVHNQVEHERYGDESTSNWRSEESRRDEKERFARDVKKQSKKYEDGVRQYGEVSEKVSNEVHGSKIIGVDDYSRNETEKLVETRGTERVYGSQTKLSNRNNNTTSSASIVQETRKQHYEKGYQGIQISEESRREPEHHTETSNAHQSYNKRVSNSRKNFSEREEQQVAAANLVLQARERNRRIGQQTEVVNDQENYTDITSHSEKRYGVKEEKLSSEANIVLEEREKKSQINQQTYFSETQESYNDRASTSEKRLSEREERLTTAVNLVLEAVTNIQKIYNDTTINSQMKFSEREEKLLAAANLVLETRERNNRVDQQIQRTDIQKSYDVEASTSQERFSEREEQQSVAIDLVLEAREKNSRLDQRTETSVIQETYNESRSTYQKQLTEREARLTTAANLVLGARERSNRMDQITEQNESTSVSQQLSRVSDIKNVDMQRASNSQRLSETRMKSVEENSTSIDSSFQEAKEQNIQANQGVVDIRRSRKESQDLINMSVTSSLNTEVLTSSQKRTETKMSTQEETSALHVDFSQGVGEKHNQTSGQIIRQVQSTREPQRPSRPSLSLSESSTESGSSTQRPLPLVNLVREQTFGSKKAQERNADMRDSQAMVTPPPSQLVIRSSPENFNQEPSDRNEIQEPSAETSESSSTALYLHPQGETPSPDDAVMSNESYTEDSNVILNEDALVSANRLEESSTMLVDEFMEKLRNEVSTSKVLEKTTSSRSHEVFEDVQSQMHGSRRSSSLSGRGGPSDEMWDVAGPSQEPSRTEAHAEVTPTDQDTTVKRTSRSLWNIVSDIVRIRWGTHSETRTPTLKSGGRTSSNESVGTEIWFSGNDADMTDDAKVKKGKRRRPKRSKSADPPNLRKGYKVMGFPESITQREGHTSSSADTVERSSASKRASSTSKEESSGHEADEKRGQNSPPSVVSTNPSLLKRRLIRSPPVQDEPLDSNIEISGSGSKDMEDSPYTERPSELIETKVKDMELKQRKFERNKQLAKERFEEWEEAFIFENEQRKTDEMFMREALLEAKKAGDTWEVPVGAVLVQHGKIIARGYNLVEALRDSTAHAEMICIREASNVLRTWRLADTTLYVTLEPCPMCAGAILQARVDTVVWGAPNKLLGADGSWVRLFPGGGEGESSSDMTNQAAGPVHPFHPKMTIRRGILGTECADIMQRFFQLRRKKKERRSESPPPPPSCLRISAHPSKILSKMHDVFHIMFCL